MKQKPKILLVIDKPNWAYDHIADFIIDQLSHKYNFHKLIAHYNILDQFKSWKYRFKELPRNFKRWKYESFSCDLVYDICVYLWWYSPHMIKKEFKYKFELRGIFTEMFPPGKTINFSGSSQKFIDEYIKPANGLIAGNKNIAKVYGNKGLPVYYATGATNTDLFKFNRKKRQGSELRVCWTGNPNRNFKGFTEFVEPAVKIAQQTHPDIQLVTRFKGPIETLPELYNTVDIMVNASIGDAGPCFLIDAGACGVPSISTDIGFASELINNYENGLIVNRDVKAIASKIVEVYENRSLLQKMSQNISVDVRRDWSQQARAKHWDKMFETALKEF